MGDVAMTVPVIQQVLEQNPDLHITIVSTAWFSPLFEPLPRCRFIGAQVKGEHKGIKGLYRLFRQLHNETSFDAIIDLHDFLRSKIVRTFFAFTGKKIAVMDKGRSEKKKLIQRNHKELHQLTTMHVRYAEVFRAAGIEVQLEEGRTVYDPAPDAANRHKIGIAPFAQHAEKMYPIGKMKEVVRTLSASGYEMILFGGGKAEADALQQWEDELPQVKNIAGKLSFQEELDVIASLGVMVSMDSANMHLASLYGIPVISIWGATHPYAGFYGWGQDQRDIIQAELECRPCSVFGNKPCFRGDHACMQMITPAQIVGAIEKKLLPKNN